MENNDNIGSDEKVCYNCQHLAWLIGVGQGLRCSHPKRFEGNYIVPSRRHTCDLFLKKNSLDDTEKKGEVYY
jgi:hypothetical protein